MHTVVEVVWDDAAFYLKDWDKKKAAKKGGLVRVSSVGHFVEETDDHICIAQSKDESDSYGELIYIPWGMVVEWYDL